MVRHADMEALDLIFPMRALQDRANGAKDNVALIGGDIGRTLSLDFDDEPLFPFQRKLQIVIDRAGDSYGVEARPAVRTRTRHANADRSIQHAPSSCGFSTRMMLRISLTTASFSRSAAASCIFLCLTTCVTATISARSLYRLV